MKFAYDDDYWRSYRFPKANGCVPSFYLSSFPFFSGFQGTACYDWLACVYISSTASQSQLAFGASPGRPSRDGLSPENVQRDEICMNKRARRENGGNNRTRRRLAHWVWLGGCSWSHDSRVGTGRPCVLPVSLSSFFHLIFELSSFFTWILPCSIRNRNPVFWGEGSVRDFIIWRHSMFLRLPQTWNVFFLSLFSFGEARPEPHRFPPPPFITKSLGIWRIHPLSKCESKRPLLRKAIISQDSVKPIFP